jgi:hypothetical protein
MKFIFLTRGYATKVSNSDYAELNRHSWYALSSGDRVYAARETFPRGKRKTILMQQAILGAPEAQLVDHKNRDSLDNQRKNLRFATRSQNMTNTARRCDNKSGFKGVSWNPLRLLWRVDIKALGRHIFLGHFKSLHRAARCYDQNARKYFGEFANPNFTRHTEQKT